MMLGTEGRPLRVAIIGSGPSGFYAADALTKAAVTVQIDFFDRLPTPYGLVRGGVAPDHQQMKSLANYYERIIVKNPNLSFFGNVKVGRDIHVKELRRFYDALIFACGAETDRKLGIPGESLEGSYTATAFVGWYNGHPDYSQYRFDLGSESVAVIGQGNVAIDVTRILAKSGNELKHSDMTPYALDALSNSKIRNIYLIGRRGPVQAAFTALELKECGELEECDIVVTPEDLELNEESQKELDDPRYSKAKKNMELLYEFSKRQRRNKKKTIFIRFFQSPKEIFGEKRVKGIVLEKNRLIGEAGNQSAQGTGETQELPCGLVFRSVGYRGLPLEGVPFDEKKGIFQNEKGRIVGNGKVRSGFYAVGWIKRGANGVLGTNKPDSSETVNTLLGDLNQLAPCESPSQEAVISFLKHKNIRYVTFSDWKRIDAFEIQKGQPIGKPREKFYSIPDMVAFLNGNR